MCWPVDAPNLDAVCVLVCAGPPLKMQQMLERGTPLGIDPTVLLLRGLNFGVEHLYLDPSPNNEAGAGYFMCGPPGGEQALLVQVSLPCCWCLFRAAQACCGLLAGRCPRPDARAPCCCVRPQCRVEGNPLNRMQFRVTVAAPDAMLAASLKDMIAGQVLAAAS